MPKKPTRSVVTAATMTAADLPKGARPEQFLTDADLVGYRQRELDALPAEDPRRPAADLALRRATKAALITAEAVAEAEALAAAELAAAG